MKLSDIMAAAGLATYAEIALVLFFGAFVSVAIWLLANVDREKIERMRQLPLESNPTDGENHR